MIKSPHFEKGSKYPDWSTLIPEDEEQVRYRIQLPAKDTFFSEDFKNTVMAMDNGEISEVIETDDLLCGSNGK